MKANPLNIVLAVAISALLAYGFWHFDSRLANYLAVGSFVFLSGTLVPCIGLSHGDIRLATNLKVLAALFFILGLIINTVFALFLTSTVFYILVSAICYLVFLFMTNALQSTA